ncbi:MAG: cupin domain-containing protein [Acidimicrobiia bacterium]|nr:cupin domain-containing protein [Acidimicrobiia bacterium]
MTKAQMVEDEHAEQMPDGENGFELAEQAANTVQAIGARIRHLRIQREKTLQALADATGLSASLLSLVERGKTSPSIGTLVSVSHALGVHMSDLVTSEQPQSKEPVRRSGDQPVFHTAQGGQRQVVADDRVRGLEIAINDFKPGGSSADSALHHGGYEYGVLLEGELTVTLDGEDHVLGPGDMISYDSTRPHRIYNSGTHLARAIWVNLDRS